MKKQIEQLIDSLADKSLTFGCRVKARGEEYVFMYENYMDNKKRQFNRLYRQEENLYLEVNEEADYQILGHPILIGDVLERLWQDGSASIHFNSEQCRSLCDTWRWLGFTKSLKEMVNEVEWVEDEAIKEAYLAGVRASGGVIDNLAPLWQVPKQKHHRELFEFLLSLNLAK